MNIKLTRHWMRRDLETRIALVLILAIVAIGFLVHDRPAFLNFFFLPVIVSGYYLGRRKAVLTAMACILLESLFLLVARQLFGMSYTLSLDGVLSVGVWACFLILTAAVIGLMAEKREKEFYNFRKAYTGVLAVVLKYLEVAGDEKSKPERVSILAGRIAEGLGLPPNEVENVKSAALLSDVQELETCLPLFTDTSRFMEAGEAGGARLTDNEKVLLKTTAALLEEIHPLIAGYFTNYGRRCQTPPADLDKVPVGSSIIGLAELHERMKSGGGVNYCGEVLNSPDDLLKMSGRWFPAKAIEVLLLLT